MAGGHCVHSQEAEETQRQCGPIRRSGFAEVDVALLEEMGHYGSGFEVFCAQATLSVIQFTSCCLQIKM